MVVLVVNSGSTSMKFKLYDMTNETIIGECNCQRVGSENSEIKYVDAQGKKHVLTQPLESHEKAVEIFVELATTGETKVIDSIEEIAAVGHRFTLGGPNNFDAALLTDQVMNDILEYLESSPLHTKVALRAVEACEDVFKGRVPSVAVFDCGFHKTRSAVSRVQPIPYELAEKYGIYRYGYHGLSYHYVSGRYKELTGNAYTDHRMVVCHMGGGGSISPILNGQAIDNSYGMLLGEGPSGATRAGSFDYALMNYISRKTGMTLDDLDDMLATKSGMLGISGITGDMKELEDLAAQGNERAKLALDVNVYQVKKYIGSFAFELGRLDTLVFTGGVGENSPYMRSRYCENLEGFGIKLDAKLNKEMNGKDAKISAPDSKVEIWIIPTNEELVMARDIAEVMSKSV